MLRKIFRAGNSLVISLPREAVDLLGADEGSEVELELDRLQRRLIVSPVEQQIPGIDQEFAAQIAEFIETYRPALDKLALGK
jgi:antitoxin MazE